MDGGAAVSTKLVLNLGNYNHTAEGFNCRAMQPIVKCEQQVYFMSQQHPQCFAYTRKSRDSTVLLKQFCLPRTTEDVSCRPSAQVIYAGTAPELLLTSYSD